MDTEVISYNLDATAGYEFSRVLDRSRDALGRDTGFQFKTASTIRRNTSRVCLLTHRWQHRPNFKSSNL